MIYVTSFDPETKRCKTRSVDSGFKSIDEVVLYVGKDYKHKARHMVIYQGIIFSTFAFQIDEPDNNAVSCLQIQQAASG
jgi:hypothetical protein